MSIEELEKKIYDPEFLPLYLANDSPGTLSAENLLLSDFYIQSLRNSHIRINLNTGKFDETFTKILMGDNELLKIRAILLTIMFKNVMNVTQTFGFLITEDRIRDSTEFNDGDDIFNDENRYFNDIFFNQLKDHPILIIDFAEIIRSFVKTISLNYDSLYPIINKIILANEDSMSPIDSRQLVFMDESDVKVEYKQRIKKTYPIILPFKMKYAEYSKYVTKGPTINIKVKREQVLDAIWLFDSVRNCEVKLKASFKDEPNPSRNDLTNEFIYVAFTNIMKKETDLFDNRNGYYWFKYHRVMTTELKKKYRCVGMFLAVTILNKRTIPIRFPRYFYKKLLHRNIYQTDLNIFDPSLFKALVYILNTDIPPTDEFDFSYKDPLNKYEIDLTDFSFVEDIENFEPAPLNDGNKVEYVEKIADWVFNISVKEAFEAFEEGYKKINSNPMLYTSFQLDEIDRIVSGDRDLDWSSLKLNAKYLSDYNADSQVIGWFWDYFNDLNDPNKFQVLKFITGSTSVPAGGLEEVQIQFYKGEGQFPRSHVCFSRIDLPEYSSYEELKNNCDEAFVIGK